MATGHLEFLDEINSYEGAILPGVRLPKIIIDKAYYESLGIEEGVDNYVFLRRLCEKGLHKYNFEDKNEYIARMNMELEVFNELGFVDYVLLNWDILNFCYENGIPTGAGRGSAGGSLVLFLIGVTKVDPLKYGLYFERFVNKSRSKKIEKDGVIYLDGSLLPDVDNDISYDRRDEVINYIKYKHRGKTSKILTLNTLSGKLCIKECGKIVGRYSEGDVNAVSDFIPKKFGRVSDLPEAYKESESFRLWADQNRDVYEIACKLEGLNKNTGVHPSGIAISFYPINEICPLQRTAELDYVSGYDMNYVAELAVKFDILGLRTLTVADYACKLIGIDLHSIDPEDPFIYKNLQNLNTPQGLFQIEADTNFKVCRKVKPKNLNELSAVIAIGRPSSLSFLDSYSSYTNYNQYQLPDIESEKLKSILMETGGCILFQETLMRIAWDVFELSLSDAELIRKACGKKRRDEMEKFNKIIEQKGQELNIPKSAKFYWDALVASADYGFNKCIFEEESVTTPHGDILLKNIKIGDLVKARDIKNNKDHYVKVLDVMRNNVKVINLWLEDGNQVAASENHKFLTEFGMKCVKDILVKGYHLYISDGNGGVKLSRIYKHASIGNKPTIDLEVDHEDHNFYVENIITSNSHAVAYGILAARTAYIKYKYPQQFFLSLLRSSRNEPDSHEEINKISSELIQFDIKLLPPDLAKSDLDFKIEGKDIRFGLNSIKGISEKTFESLQSFRETSTPTKFDIFIAAKQAGINIGLLSSLIQAGTLSSYTNRRSRLVLEAQAFNILTDKEKTNAISLGLKYNWDILTIISENVVKAKTTMSNGKPFMTEKRFATFKKKYEEYKKIYDQNKDHEAFANWVFEYKLLGYTPSTRLKTVFKQDEITFTDTLEYQSVLQNERIKVVGVIQEVYKSKSKKTNKPFYKFKIKDEVGAINALFLDSGKSERLSEYLEDKLPIPQEDDIVVFTGRKGEDILWVENIAVLNDKIYMKLSDVE